MLIIDEITEIFYLCDEFSSEFEYYYPKHALREGNGKKHRYKPTRLSDSEVIEFVIDKLKNICQIEHTRHRSFTNFLTNLIAGLLPYSSLPQSSQLE